MKTYMPSQKGFTLVELLVVISIVALLTGIIISQVSKSRESSDYLKSTSDLGQIKLALTNYQLKYGKYPSTGGAYFAGYGSCLAGNVANVSLTYIPQLVPVYLGSLPIAKGASAGCTNGPAYIYRSDNGSEYKLIFINTPVFSQATRKNPEMVDPVRSGATKAYGFWSEGGAAY